jgi:hypothetical protein
MASKIIKKVVLTAVVVVLVTGLMGFVHWGTVYASSLEGRGGPGGRGGNGNDTPNPGGTPRTPLSGDETEALNRAILEEYGALNLYQSVISQLSNVAPFSRIVNAEQQHVNALTRQATKYGIPVPPNPGLSPQPSFSTFGEACTAGVDAETVDAALYDELKPIVTHDDIIRVFNNLQNASLNNHLPAFQDCQ